MGVLVVFILYASLIVSSSNAAIFRSLGVNYGQLGDNLPSPTRSVHLLRSLRAGAVKIYDANPSILSALSHTNLKVSIMVPNELIPSLAANLSSSSSWLRSNLLPFLPATRIRFLLLGNELLSDPVRLPSHGRPAIVRCSLPCSHSSPELRHRPPSPSDDDDVDVDDRGKVFSHIVLAQSASPSTAVRCPASPTVDRAAVLVFLFEDGPGDHETATRETKEEMGLDPSLVTVVAMLEPFSPSTPRTPSYSSSSSRAASPHMEERRDGDSIFDCAVERGRSGIK